VGAPLASFRPFLVSFQLPLAFNSARACCSSYTVFIVGQSWFLFQKLIGSCQLFDIFFLFAQIVSILLLVAQRFFFFFFKVFCLVFRPFPYLCQRKGRWREFSHFDFTLKQANWYHNLGFLLSLEQGIKTCNNYSLHYTHP
jgi:hypothetical protein